MDRFRHFAVSLLLVGLLGLSLHRTFLGRTPPLPRLDGRCAAVSVGAGSPRLLCAAGDAELATIVADSLADLTGCSPDVVASAVRRRGAGELEWSVIRGRSSSCAPEARPLGQGATFASGRPMDLCRASEEELRMLPGIGVARARAIVEHRRDHGLAGLEGLVDVEGIGPGTVRRLRGHVLVECGEVSPAAAGGRADAPN